MDEWERDLKENGLPCDPHGHWPWRKAGRPSTVKQREKKGKI